jgi:sensor histidine kinase YesM
MHASSTPTVRLSSLGRRFWLLYLAGWAPYIGLYVSALLFSDELPARTGIVAGINSALPAAVFGVGVIAVCLRVPWRPGGLGRFVRVHVTAAILYATVCASFTCLLFYATWSFFTQHIPEKSHALSIAPWQFFMGLLIYTILASLMYAFQSTARLREEEHRATRAEALKAKAELRALRAQLNPHFLFNTLHTLIALVRHDPDAAEDAIEQFGDLLRYASRIHQDTRDEVTLGEEWEFVENYLALESLRVGDRLRVHAHLDDDAKECFVPAFCLQPLVENAVRHGIAPRAGGGTIRITAAILEGGLRLEVLDDGLGADPEAVAGNGRQGLRLVRQRLEALYRERARFTVVTAPGKGFAVRMDLPAQRHYSSKGGRTWSGA